MILEKAAHVAFVLPHFHGGGAERLTAELIEGFAERGAQVDLVLMEAWGDFLALLPQGVRVVDLKAPRLRQVPRALRRYMLEECPDAVLAAMWPLTTMAILARAGLRARPRLVLADHCPLQEQYAAEPLTLAALKLTAATTYRMADGLVGVSQGLSQELARLACLPSSRVTTITNPIPPPRRSKIDPEGLWQGRTGTRVLSVGQLKPAKNFPLLLRAFAQFSRRHEAVLAIVGEDVCHAGLGKLAAELGIADRVLLPGFTATPGDWYAGADIFALASDYEGLGNVLVEAMHCGLPVVATDCPYGPAEILEAGKWGRLVPCGDAGALAGAMAEAIAAPSDRAPLQARAAQFSVGRAVGAYWQMLLPA